MTSHKKYICSWKKTGKKLTILSKKYTQKSVN